MLRRRWTPAPSITGSGVTTCAIGRDDRLMLCLLPPLQMQMPLCAIQAYAPGLGYAIAQSPTAPLRRSQVAGLSRLHIGRTAATLSLKPAVLSLDPDVADLAI